MPTWKVLLIVALACSCFALASATLVVPMTAAAGEYRWMWLGGLLTATVGMCTLFALFLRSADRAFRM